jgi:hypothetical protein
MDRYIAVALRAAALSGELSEEAAAAHLQELLGETVTLANGAVVPALNIVTSEPLPAFVARTGPLGETFGVSDDPRSTRATRLEPVVSVETRTSTKLARTDDGWAEVEVTTYEASSAPYALPDGRVTRDVCAGSAPAVLARLLEAVAEDGGAR